MKQFRLTDQDKQILLECGYLNRDFAQIEFAAQEVDLFYDNKKISIDTCIELLGRKRFLTGIARAAFHWSASRCVSEDGRSSVLFDGYAMWTRWVS